MLNPVTEGKIEWKSDQLVDKASEAVKSPLKEGIMTIIAGLIGSLAAEKIRPTVDQSVECSVDSSGNAVKYSSHKSFDSCVIL